MQLAMKRRAQQKVSGTIVAYTAAVFPSTSASIAEREAMDSAALPKISVPRQQDSSIFAGTDATSVVDTSKEQLAAFLGAQANFLTSSAEA